MTRRRIAVIGAGGCAREVAWTIRDVIRAGADLELVGYVVSDLAKLGENDRLSQPVFDFAQLAATKSVDALVLGVGSPVLRRKLLAEAAGHFPDAEWPAIVHPSVQTDVGSCTFGEGVVVCASAVVTVNVRIAPHVLVHYGCSVSHESSIGEMSTLNPGCVIAGGVTVEEGVTIGAGATVLQYRRVGARSIVGAGAVVTRDVPPDTTVAGVPARLLR